jgi:hypothetical protein
MEKTNNPLIKDKGSTRSFFREPRYPILCNVDGHLIAAKSDKTLAKELSGLELREDAQYDVIDSTGEGWLLLVEVMVLSPLNFRKRRWTKLEIIRLFNNRTNKLDPDEKPCSEKLLSAKKFDRIFRDLVDRLYRQKADDRGPTSDNDETANAAEFSEQYRRIREITLRLNNEVLPRYLPKKAFHTCGQKLGMMKNNTLVLSDMDHTSVLMDYCLYEYREHGQNAISRYLAETPLETGSDEYRVARAMSESFYALLMVEQVRSGIGVLVLDILRERSFLLMDLNFSHTAVPGVVIATRVLPFDGFAITTGAPLGVDAEIMRKIENVLVQRVEDERKGQNDAQKWTDLATTVIRMSLRGESSTRIEYGDVDIQSINGPLRRDARVGRNDPCPCGSGKKYKRCCGTPVRV